MRVRQHRGRGTEAAFGSEPDRSCRPKITSISSGEGSGMELDATPATAGVGAAGTSSAAADGVLDGVADVEAVVAVDAAAAAGGGSLAPLPADACC
jgi:hypothetical protein